MDGVSELIGEPVSALSLPEQLLLLAVDVRRGRLRGSPNLYVAMAGGLVQELVAADATVDDGTLRLVDPAVASSLPDALRERAVATVRGAPPRTIRDWVRAFAAPGFRLGQQVSGALETRGVLHLKRSRRLGLIPTQRVQLPEETVRAEILVSARTALAASAPPAPKVQALLVLADAAGLTDQFVDPPERAAARQRIRRLAAGVSAAAPVDEVAAQIHAEVMAAVTAATTTATISS